MKIAVIGANGFTGRRILRSLALHKEHSIYGISLNADQWPSEGYHFIEADITGLENMANVLERISPDMVINTAALSVADYCERNQKEAYMVNVAAVEHLAVCCERLGARLIHLSTDFVFDGKQHAFYTEEDQPNPVNYYGYTKWKGEQAVAENCSNWAIGRVVLVYGQPFPGQHNNIAYLVKSKLENNETVRVVADQWRTLSWVEDVVQGIKLLAFSSHNGIYHICGNECLSIAQIAYRVAGCFGLDSSLIIPVATEEMKETVNRPKYSCLSIDKACRELGYKPHSLEAGLGEMW